MEEREGYVDHTNYSSKEQSIIRQYPSHKFISRDDQTDKIEKSDVP